MEKLLLVGECFKCGGTKNKDGKKHRANDDDAPCKLSGIVPAKHNPCLKATVNQYQAPVEDSEESDSDSDPFKKAKN